jgi:hypothetical protein
MRLPVGEIYRLAWVSIKKGKPFIQPVITYSFPPIFAPLSVYRPVSRFKQVFNLGPYPL